MSKKVLLIVEPPMKSINRIFNFLKKPSNKYVGTMIITFPNYEILGKIITGERLKLLGMIRKHKPKSIQELAKIVDRDFKNVYQDVQLLSQYGLISLKSKGPRKASEIKALYSEIILAA